MVYSKFEDIPFQNRAKRAALRQTYAVLFFLKKGLSLKKAIREATKSFPQIHDEYQSVQQKISTRLGVPSDTFFKLYETGSLLPKLTGQWKLSKDDERIFAELLNPTYLGSISFPCDIEDTILFEGHVKKIIVNAYERNPEARQRCIEYYGTICSVCEFKFEHKYGEIGREYIQVHHVKPLSELRENYVVDPIQDLRPICPNCHAMIHMRKPPYTIEEMKSIIDNVA